MQKIPTIFERDWDGDRSRVVDIPHKDCGWVFAGEGVATRKLDGTCCMVRDGELYKRREVKGRSFAPPPGFELVSNDEETGKSVGWVPAGDWPENKYHLAAFDMLPALPDGTYELIGPHIRGNPERVDFDQYVAHASDMLVFGDVPRDFDGLREWLRGRDIEGIVFHHPDGRMGKIKLKDFGLKRGG